MTSDRVQGRLWSIVLWVDDRTYNECQKIIMTAIDNINNNHFVKYAFILHDKDSYTADEYVSYLTKNQKEPSWQVGDPKPEHYHIYIEVANNDKIDLSFIYNSFQKIVEKVYIKRINNDTKFIRYLIHADNPDKYQYNDLLIVSNIDSIDNYFIYDNYTTNVKYNFVKLLIDYVDNFTDSMGTLIKPKFKDVAKWCIENDFSDMLLKYSYFIHCLID